MGIAQPRMGSKAVVDALPPAILALFQPRPPLDFLKPMTKAKCRAFDGIASFMDDFEKAEDVPERAAKTETKEQRQERKGKERAARISSELADAKEAWKPKENAAATEDAYKTLFVGRINFETTEARLKREFEPFGEIKNLVMVKDKNDKPRGHAFIEFERERDMRTAYKQADGKKIDGRRVVVDVERGRTVNGWMPRRLGGGLGFTRKGGKGENQTASGRVMGGGNEASDRDREKDSGRRRERSPRREEKKESRRDERRDRDSDRRRDRSPAKEDKDRRRDRSPEKESRRDR